MGRKRPEKKSDPIVKYLLENYEINSAQDIEEALKDLLSGTIEGLLKAELDEHLDYTLKGTREYGETPLSLNTRNGSSSKKVKSSYGEMDINIPRDRESTFEPQALKKYQKTEIQKCVIHQIRNSTRYVSYIDIRELMADMKKVYKAPTEESALLQLDLFEDKWNDKYPICVKSWKNNWAELATYFKYPQEIRTLIYTTNAIEAFNRQLRKVTKNKAIFPTDFALSKSLYLAMADASLKWTSRVRGWDKIYSQLSIYFEGRI